MNEGRRKHDQYLHEQLSALDSGKQVQQPKQRCLQIVRSLLYVRGGSQILAKTLASINFSLLVGQVKNKKHKGLMHPKIIVMMRIVHHSPPAS